MLTPDDVQQRHGMDPPDRTWIVTVPLRYAHLPRSHKRKTWWRTLLGRAHNERWRALE